MKKQAFKCIILVAVLLSAQSFGATAPPASSKKPVTGNKKPVMPPAKAPNKETVAPVPSPQPFSEQPFDDGVTVVPLNYLGHDVERIYKAATALTLVKGEFETTAEFEARKANADSAKLYGSVNLDSLLALARPVSSAYDADNKTFNLQFFISEGPIMLVDMSRIGKADDGMIEFRSKIIEESSYIGENGFGAKTRIFKTVKEASGILFQGWSKFPLQKSWEYATNPEGRLSIPMEIEKAKTVKDNLKILFLYHLRRPPTVSDVDYGGRITVDSPYDNKTTYSLLQGSIEQIWIYDGKSGEIFAKFPNLASEISPLPAASSLFSEPVPPPTPITP